MIIQNSHQIDSLKKQNMHTSNVQYTQVIRFPNTIYSTIQQEIKYEIEKDTNKINTMLSSISQMKRINNLLKKCDAVLQDNDEEKSKALLYKYQSQYDYASEFQPYELEPYILSNQASWICMEVQCKGNWIQKYLDQSDITVYGKFAGNRVKIIGESEGIVEFVNVDTIKLGHGLEAGRGEKIRKPLKQFYAHNKMVALQFNKNNFKHEFGSCIVRMFIQESKIQKHRVLLQVINQQGENLADYMRRVLVFRLDKIQDQRQQYRIHQSFYQLHNFTQSLLLQPGQYLLIPFPKTKISLYISDKSSYQFQIVQPQNRSQIKQMNLLLQGFPQCHIQNINAQFTRDCDFDAGIVIEVYRNIYNNQILFQDLQPGKQEDKKLMFQSLYSKRYRSYRLRRGETVVEFYEVTKKPAVLYQPKKKVIVDKKQDLEAQTVHSILK